MHKILTTMAIVGLLGSAGCSNMSTTEQRTLSGGAIGAGTGAAVSGVTGGSMLGGAILGGALGAGAGYLYDRHDDDHHH